MVMAAMYLFLFFLLFQLEWQGKKRVCFAKMQTHGMAKLSATSKLNPLINHQKLAMQV
jgi:hypothetical protein